MAGTSAPVCSPFPIWNVIRRVEGSIKIMRSLSRLLLAGTLFSLPVSAMHTPLTRSPGADYFQESGIGTSLGKLTVRPEVMAGRCITMVSPIYPRTNGETPAPATVVVRVVIWKSGRVSPIRVVSGPPSLQAEATNAVRLWRYKPFIVDQGPVDVTTDLEVDFIPGQPGGILTHPNH